MLAPGSGPLVRLYDEKQIGLKRCPRVPCHEWHSRDHTARLAAAKAAADALNECYS